MASKFVMMNFVVGAPEHKCGNWDDGMVPVGVVPVAKLPLDDQTTRGNNTLAFPVRCHSKCSSPSKFGSANA